MLTTNIPRFVWDSAIHNHNNITFSTEFAPPPDLLQTRNYQFSPQHLYSGGGGYQPTFTASQLQQGMAHCDYCSILLMHRCRKLKNGSVETMASHAKIAYHR